VIVQASAGWMISVPLAGKGLGWDAVQKLLQATTHVEELLQRVSVVFSVLSNSNSNVILRSEARILRNEELAETGVSARDIVDVYVCEGGGMMENSQSQGTNHALAESGEATQASESGKDLANEVEALLGELTHDVWGIEGAMQRLDTVRKVNSTLSAADVPAWGQTLNLNQDDGESKDKEILELRQRVSMLQDQLLAVTNVGETRWGVEVKQDKEQKNSHNNSSQLIEGENLHIQNDEAHLYLQAVVECLQNCKEEKDTDGRKEVEEQIEALNGVMKVMEARLSPAADLVFDSRLDDDEVLLALLSAIDKGDRRNGSISKKELFESEFLKEDQNKEIGKIFQSVFECDFPEFEKALVHLKDKDFLDFLRLQEGAIPSDKGIIDRKLAVKALFDSALKMNTNSHAERIAASDVRSGATKVELEELAKACNINSKLALALKSIAKALLSADRELDFLAIKKAARRVPRVSGQRMQWVQSLGLDAMLARHLPPGRFDDGMVGVRGMPKQDALRALEAFSQDVKYKFLTSLKSCKKAKGSADAVQANSKFQGFQGSFATLKMFHKGAEATLKLGYPNPNIMHGIMLEHTAHSSATRLFATTNYCIATNLLIEYWWATLEENPGPTGAAIRARACAQLKKHSNLRSDNQSMHDAAKSAADDTRLLFPGEVADSFVQSIVFVTAKGVDTGHRSLDQKSLSDAVNKATGMYPVDKEASRKLVAAVKQAAGSVLITEEEQVRGMTVMDRASCLEWMSTNQSILQTEAQDNDSDVINPELEANCDLVLVGVVLPMSATRATKHCTTIAQAVAFELPTQHQILISAYVAARKTVVFGRHASIDMLRKELGSMSLAELREEACKLKKDFAGERAELCDMIIASFVRTDLRGDLKTALENAWECNAESLEAKMKALLQVWGKGNTFSQSNDRMKMVVDLLNLENAEDIWSKMKDWVRLYCGRIQGRKRIGLKNLMKHKAEEILRHHLQDGEVLALYIYTGVPARTT
jgi:hypothetical protein